LGKIYWARRKIEWAIAVKESAVLRPENCGFTQVKIILVGLDYTCHITCLGPTFNPLTKMQHWWKTFIICAVPCYFWAAIATPVWADQRWEGNGRIVRGAGNGASVPKLKLETDDDFREWIFFLSGPDAGQRVRLSQNHSVTTASGVWRFSPSSRRPEAKLYQDNPYRVIHYRLQSSD